MMHEVKSRPPNFDEIVAVFPSAKTTPGVLYACGDTIYNPDGVKITKALQAHEEAHGERQLAIGVAEWWKFYLADSAFRFAEELVAHQAEWRAFKLKVPMPTRREREDMLGFIASRLAGPLYGNMLSIEEAARKVDE